MPINGASQMKDVFAYCSDWLVCIEDTELWDSATQTVNMGHPQAGVASALVGTFNRLRIPNFQRGIEWDFEMLEACITSKSKTLGIAVIGRTIGIPTIDFVLDGLQRFSAFTYLIYKLDRLLFEPATAGNPNPWGLHPQLVVRPSLAVLQNQALRALGLRSRFSYNYHALQLLRRKAVSQSFRNFTTKVDQELQVFLNPRNNTQINWAGQFMDALADFLSKPLFVQEIFNFASVPELLSTFKGLNTIRVELTPADVCRATIVDTLVSANGNAQDVLRVDNEFNDAFLTPTGRVRRGLDPLIRVLEHELGESTTHRLLPALFAVPLNNAQILGDFDSFVAWIAFFENCRSSSNFVELLANIGDNPYVASLVYFYHQHRAANTLNVPPADSDVHQIAVAYLRKLLDGGVGDTLPVTKQAGAGDYGNLGQFLNAVNPDRAGQMNTQVPTTWLLNAIDSIKSIQTAPVIFNACQLPVIRGAGAVPFGQNFSILTFERGANNWSIDHLIPQNTFDAGQGHQPSPGDPYKDTMRNFAPVIGSDNSSYKATDCSTKLDLAAAYYSSYRTDARKLAGGQPVRFLDELLNRQGAPGGDPELNSRDWLANVHPNGRCYGRERIEILRDLLLVKI